MVKDWQTKSTKVDIKDRTFTQWDKDEVDV